MRFEATTDMRHHVRAAEQDYRTVVNRPVRAERLAGDQVAPGEQPDFVAIVPANDGVLQDR